MNQKIIDYFKQNKIDVEITQVIESLQLTTYFIKINSSINSTIINKIQKSKEALQLYLQIDNINIKMDNITGSFIIEIPCINRKTLTYKELVNNYIKNSNGLYCNVGIDTQNKIKNINLCDLPHLLVAGTTGSGKSVLINSIILQLLENYTPLELELILIDIKQVEFSIYSGIPHLLYEPITEFDKSKKVLNECIDDMTNRYELLKNSNCRNIAEYNQKNFVKMKYKLIVIDELAELLMLEQNKLKSNLENKTRIDELICRIAQLGRAAGIHLIVATQRPSSDVISGLIKSNIPSRIALTVANNTNSRIIIDQAGAENLTGKGDLLLKVINDNKLTRLQSAFITNSELLERLTEVKNKYNYKNTKQINDRNILKELEIKLNRMMSESNNKTVAKNLLQEKQWIDGIIQELTTDETEQKQLYNNYFKILHDVLLSYNGYIAEEKRQEKQTKEIQRQQEKQAKLKRRDRLLCLHIINEWLK